MARRAPMAAAALAADAAPPEDATPAPAPAAAAAPPPPPPPPRKDETVVAAFPTAFKAHGDRRLRQETMEVHGAAGPARAVYTAPNRPAPAEPREKKVKHESIYGKAGGMDAIRNAGKSRSKKRRYGAPHGPLG